MAKYRTVRTKGKPAQVISENRDGSFTARDNPKGHKIKRDKKAGYRDEKGFAVLRGSDGRFHV